MIRAYQSSQQQRALAMPRIDVILGVYDEALKKLERVAALLADEPNTARRLLLQCQVGVAGLAASLDPLGGEVTANLRRLYEFVSHCLAEESPQKLGDAVHILTILRDGFEAVRADAVELERQGQIPSLDRDPAVQALA